MAIPNRHIRYLQSQKFDDSDDLISRIINNGIDNQVKVIFSVRKNCKRGLRMDYTKTNLIC